MRAIFLLFLATHSEGINENSYIAMAVRAVLRLNEREYEVRTFEQIFQLPIQRVDGYPSGPFPYNGELLVDLSTPPDDYLID